jgi:hypothetical protein
VKLGFNLLHFGNFTEDNLFAIDRRGFHIHCDEEQMDRIYAHHPELINFWADEEDMRLAIQDARIIYQSTHGKDFNVYYLQKSGANTELKVVVKFQEKQGILYMAQPISKRPDGEVMIWPINH